MFLFALLVLPLLTLSNVKAQAACDPTPPPNPGGITIDVIGRTTALSDGAHWNPSLGVLYYVDPLEGILYRYNPISNSTTSVSVGIGIATALEISGSANGLVVPVNLTVYQIEWDGSSSQIQSSSVLFSINDRTKNRIESAKADINGVLFAGTQGNVSLNDQGLEVSMPNLASLYRYENETDTCTCSLHTILTPITSACDLAWSPDNTIMYFVDESVKTIFAFDYDLGSAQLSNQRVFFNLSDFGYADTATHSVNTAGVAVDTDGNLWVPIYGVGQLLQVSSEGQIIATYTLPTILLTSCVFGGDTLSTLYCTSSANYLKPEEVAGQPDAGAVFAINGLGTHGINGGGYPVVVCSSPI